MWKQLAATSSRQIRWMKNLTRCRICAYFHFTNYNFLMIVLVHSLLDPSCSGSGIVNRMDYLMEHGGVADPHICQTLINCVKRRSGLWEWSEWTAFEISRISTIHDQACYGVCVVAFRSCLVPKQMLTRRIFRSSKSSKNCLLDLQVRLYIKEIRALCWIPCPNTIPLRQQS